MIIAVDFDGTLCQNEYPRIGGANMALLDHLAIRRENGDTLILWTCRSGQLLINALAWCEAYGLRFDFVNENTPEIVERFGDSRKIYADLYIDDKSCLPDALVTRKRRYRR